MTRRPLARGGKFLFAIAAWLATGCGWDDNEETGGLRVESVEPWGAAAVAGIEAGDVVESWRSSTAGGAVSDPLELLWIEYDVAPREPVTLTVRKGAGRSGGDREEYVLEDAVWEIATRPPLPASVRAAYQKTRTEEENLPAAWDELEDRVAAVVPEAAAWAAWRRGVASAPSSERAEEASEAFQRARDLTVGRPEIVALLHAEEGQTFWMAAQFEKADGPSEAATAALREVDATSPLLGFQLIREGRILMRYRRFDDARRALAEAEKILDVHPRSRELRAAFEVRRASIEAKAEYLQEAEAAYRSALALWERPQDPYVALVGLDLGNVLRDQGQYEEALEWYRRALVLAPRSPRERFALAAANNNLGLLSKKLGSYDHAERYYRRALELFPAGSMADAGMRNNLGNLALNRGDLSLAAEYHRAALELRLALQPESSSVASSYHNLAVVLRDEGRLQEADPLFAKALAIKTELVPDSMLMAMSLEDWGRSKLLLGEFESASELASRACEIYQTLAPDSLELGRCRLYLGDVKLAEGHRGQAMELWRRGLGIIEDLRIRIPGEQGKARFAALFDDFYRKLAAGYLEDGEVERAFLTLESARARMLRALLQQYGDRAALTASPELLEARRRTDARIEQDLNRLGRLHPGQDAEEVRELHQRLRSLESEREEINENLYRVARGLERIERVPSISIPRIRRGLPAGSVGLLYTLGARRSHVFVVHPGSEEPGVEAVELAVDRKGVARRIEIFRSLLERGRDGGALETATLEQGSRLFDDLLAPVADRLRSASRLYVAPDAALTGLPFAALIQSREPLKFFAEWMPHAVVPSLSSLVELRQERAEKPRPELELVAAGAPDMESPEATERARRLGRLPGARQEIDDLEKIFGTGVLALTGEQATEPAVRDGMQRGRYVHFATHALLDRRFPMSSSLVLSVSETASVERDDGLLHGWEILENPPLAAELVFLAGCETGRGAEWEGEGLIGLAQAFHYAGAPAVLASQWRIGDDWAGELSRTFYGELLAGREPMLALAAAQRQMIAADGSTMRHPYYWAALTLFGVGD